MAVHCGSTAVGTEAAARVLIDCEAVELGHGDRAKTSPLHSCPTYTTNRLFLFFCSPTNTAGHRQEGGLK